MIIRLAAPSDASALSRLATDVQGLHAQQHPNVFKMPDGDDFATSLFEDMLADPTVKIFIAQEDGNPIGYVLCKLIERPENPFTFAARTLLIDQISVHPIARGKGVGAALMQRAEVLARESGSQRIHLDSWDFNLNAQAFFEHLGFQKSIFRFWKYL